MTDRTLDVIVAGHVCLDVIPSFNGSNQYKVESIFIPGKLMEMGSVSISTGGPVSNTGIPLVKLGMKVSFMASIGDDEIGMMILDKLREWGQVDGVSINHEQSSSYTVVMAPPGIDRMFFHSPGANNSFCSDDVNYDLCAQARLFHLGYPPLMRSLYDNDGDELLGIFKRVKECGTTTSLDMALPDPNSEAGKVDWPRVFERVLPYVDLFHPSAEEALFMASPQKWRNLRNQYPAGDLIDYFKEQDFASLSNQFLGWGAKIVTIKAGHRGFYMRSGQCECGGDYGSAAPEALEFWQNRKLWKPAYRLDTIASTTGAGDCSIAGFLTAFLKGLAPEQCVAAANALGYQNVSALDAISGVKDWQSTLAIMDSKILPRFDLERWPHDHVLKSVNEN